MRRSTHPTLRAPLRGGDLSDKSLLCPSRRTKRKISLLEIFLMAVETLWSNKVRSGLTMLGVIIGISSVIAITSIGQGVQKDTEMKLDIAKPVVVLGSKVWNDLFSPSENPISADIRVRGKHYQVIGVMESKGSIGGQDADDIIYLPLTNMSAEIVGNNSLTGTAINGFLLQSSNGDQLEAAQFQVTNVLRLRHNIRPPKEDDFRVTNQVDIINTFTSIMSSFTLMIGAIAGISLIVGGIGIANIMLVSVMERMREIGLRKAVGATSSAILNQFLMESIVISSIGGAIGIGLGIAIAFTAATVFKFPFVVSLWSVVLGFVISLIVGVLAGGIPARNAAKLDPILALHGD